MESTHFLVSTPYFWCHLALLLGEDKDLQWKLMTAFFTSVG